MGKPAKHKNGHLPFGATPSEDYAQAQEDELEVLKAIYMDDFEEVEAKGAWHVCFLINSLSAWALLTLV